MIVDEVAYLEHFGVKGMHWGVRNKRQKEPGILSRAPKGDWHLRTGKQKAGLVLGGVVGNSIGGLAAQSILRGRGGNAAQALAGGLGIVAGVRVARHIMDKHEGEHVAKVPKFKGQNTKNTKALSDDEINRMIAEHLKTHPKGKKNS